MTKNTSVLSRSVRHALRARPLACVTSGMIAAGVAVAFARAITGGPSLAEFELMGLLPSGGGDGGAGFVLRGIDENDRTGEAVSRAGDVNGDGVGDLIVAGFGGDPAGRSNASETFVLFGRGAAQGPFAPEIPLSSLKPAGGGDGSAGFVLHGIGANDGYGGGVVSAAGDVNGDGIDDLAIGVQSADPDGGNTDAGETYVVFGRMGGFPAVIELSSLLPANGGDGSTGFVLNGNDQRDYAGAAVSGAGDLNGDGVDDLVVGAFLATPDSGTLYAGETYVVFGRDATQGRTFPAAIDLGTLLPANGGDGSAGFVLIGAGERNYVGWAVTRAGDVNGDGIGDLLIGAPPIKVGGDQSAGASYVVFGRDVAQAGGFPPLFEVSSLLPANGGDGSAGFALAGIDAFDLSGWAVSAAGDVNGDIVDDIVASAPYADPDGRLSAGETYVLFGRVTAFPAVIALSSLLPVNGGDGSRGVVVNGVEGSDYAGRDVSGAGDVNGDGIDDLLLGANRATPGGREYAGTSYLVYGRGPAQGGWPAVFELSTLLRLNGGDGSAGFALNGVSEGDESGAVVSAAGDVNDDGLDDVVIGAAAADPGDRSRAGESYVVFGALARPDTDGDDVVDERDLCAATTLPESVPFLQLLPRRFALMNEDTSFETRIVQGTVTSNLTTTSTSGCSCQQIVAQLGLGAEQILFGCTEDTIRTWIGSDTR